MDGFIDEIAKRIPRDRIERMGGGGLKIYLDGEVWLKVVQQGTFLAMQYQHFVGRERQWAPLERSPGILRIPLVDRPRCIDGILTMYFAEACGSADMEIDC